MYSKLVRVRGSGTEDLRREESHELSPNSWRRACPPSSQPNADDSFRIPAPRTKPPLPPLMDGDLEKEEAAERAELLRDRFRLSVISIAEAEAKKLGMEIAEPVVACIADLAFKQTEDLAKDVEQFAQHAGRKSVNMEDAILAAHRNEHLTSLLRSFSHELKGKDPLTEKKRKRSSKKEDKANPS